MKSITASVLLSAALGFSGCTSDEDDDAGSGGNNKDDAGEGSPEAGESQADGSQSGSDAGNGDNPGNGGEAGSGADAGDPDAAVVGTPTGTWSNVTGELAGLASECGNVGGLVATPNGERLLVGVARHGLYESTDGASWDQIGTGTGSDPIVARTTHILFDPDAPDTFYVAGIYVQPGILKTTDDGDTFKALGDVWHTDTVGVDFTDPERKTLIAGTHEQGKIVWHSTDGGETWANIGENIPSEASWSNIVHVVDAQTFLLGTHNTGIYRTENAGGSWTKVSDVGGGAAPLVASDGSIYWASADAGGLVRSTDDGETWEQVAESGIVYGIPPIELPDGRIATRGSAGVLVSSDHGEHWVAVAPPEPFSDPFRGFNLAYLASEKAFFVAQWTCNDVVADDAVARFDWDYQE